MAWEALSFEIWQGTLRARQQEEADTEVGVGPGNPGSPSAWGERKWRRREASVSPPRADRMTARLKAKAHWLNERVTPVCKLPLPPASPPGGCLRPHTTMVTLSLIWNMNLKSPKGQWILNPFEGNFGAWCRRESFLSRLCTWTSRPL